MDRKKIVAETKMSEINNGKLMEIKILKPRGETALGHVEKFADKDSHKDNQTLFKVVER